jgi:hypothetical protein
MRPAAFSRVPLAALTMFAASVLVASTPVHAEILTLACKEDVIKKGVPPGIADQTIVVTSGGSPSVEIRAQYGTFKFPARVRKNEGGLAVDATGTGESRMPSKRDVDQCLGKHRASHPEEGGELNMWVAQTCRLEAAETPEPVKVDVTVEVVIVEPDMVVTTVERGYAGDDPAADQRYAMPSRPSCTVQSRK